MFGCLRTRCYIFDLKCREKELMLLENLVTRRVSEENASNFSLTLRVTKQGHLLLAALDRPQWHCAEWRGLSEPTR